MSEKHDQPKHAHLLRDPKMPKVDFRPIRELIGEHLMPDLMPGPRGRQRLALALEQRYGANYRTITSARRAMEHFEGETAKVRHYLRLKGVKNG